AWRATVHLPAVLPFSIFRLVHAARVGRVAYLGPARVPTSRAARTIMSVQAAKRDNERVCHPFAALVATAKYPPRGPLLGVPSSYSDQGNPMSNFHARRSGGISRAAGKVGRFLKPSHPGRRRLEAKSSFC